MLKYDMIAAWNGWLRKTSEKWHSSWDLNDKDPRVRKSGWNHYRNRKQLVKRPKASVPKAKRKKGSSINCVVYSREFQNEKKRNYWNWQREAVRRSYQSGQRGDVRVKRWRNQLWTIFSTHFAIKWTEKSDNNCRVIWGQTWSLFFVL